MTFMSGSRTFARTSAINGSSCRTSSWHSSPADGQCTAAYFTTDTDPTSAGESTGGLGLNDDDDNDDDEIAYFTVR